MVSKWRESLTVPRLPERSKRMRPQNSGVPADLEWRGVMRIKARLNDCTRVRWKITVLESSLPTPGVDPELPSQSAISLHLPGTVWGVMWPNAVQLDQRGSWLEGIRWKCILVFRKEKLEDRCPFSFAVCGDDIWMMSRTQSCREGSFSFWAQRGWPNSLFTSQTTLRMESRAVGDPGLTILSPRFWASLLSYLPSLTAACLLTSVLLVFFSLKYLVSPCPSSQALLSCLCRSCSSESLCSLRRGSWSWRNLPSTLRLKWKILRPQGGPRRFILELTSSCMGPQITSHWRSKPLHFLQAFWSPRQTPWGIFQPKYFTGS